MDPFSITTGIISVANGTFTFAINFWKLKNVDDDLKICLQLLLMMAKDINGARKLRSLKYPQDHSQIAIPDSLLDRANCAIKNLEDATNEMSKCVEAVRVQKSVNNSISIAQRFSWVFNQKDNFIVRQWVVNAAHVRVLSVIGSLESLPDTLFNTSVPPPTYEEAILRSPSQMRALKGKSTAIVVTEREHPIDPALVSTFSTPRPQSHRSSSSSLSASSPVIYEEYTDEDMVNEKILLRWQSSKRRQNT